MIFIKKVTIMFFCKCLIISFLSVPFIAVARDVTVVPSITLRGEYDDNVYFTRTDEISDYLAIISPGLKLDYATEVFNIRGSGLVDVLRYVDEKDINTENQRYTINGGYQLMERWALSGDFSYIKDTTLDSELEETGIVYVREDRERFNAGAGLSYQVSELSDMGVNYAYSKTGYDEQGLEDYDVNSISLSYNRKFNEGIDVFTIQPGYARFSSDVSDVDGYRLNFGWTHLPGETYRLRIILGARYSEQDYKDDRDKTSNWGGVADISLLKKAEIYSVLVGFNSDAYSEPSTGELNKVYKIYCNLTRRVTERFSAGVNSRLSLTQPDDADAVNDKEIWYFTVTPSLSYRLTENHSLRLSYSYQQQYDRNIEDDPRIARNRVWLSLNFNFPKKW
ncbi:MAG: outer membrane beta-barrel protein [Desulfobacterales bacterium]|nr:outer membrane beta-barrel protein [Desulfobacterales bacterium]